MQLYWPHLIAVTHTTATILAQSKIVALECAALYVAPIGGATHSSATILPFLPLLVLFWINNPNQMLKNINSISVWQFWLNKVGSNVSLRHLKWWLKIESFNLDLLSLCPSKILEVVLVTNALYLTILTCCLQCTVTGWTLWGWTHTWTTCTQTWPTVRSSFKSTKSSGRASWTGKESSDENSSANFCQK